MKPLLVKDFASFMLRFNNFKDGEFRSLEVISPTTMKITLAGQDEAREFDWVSLELEFSGINNARLLDESKLSLVDMEDGISLISNNNSVAFGLGSYTKVSNILNATCFIISSDVKYQEGSF